MGGLVWTLFTESDVRSIRFYISLAIVGQTVKNPPANIGDVGLIPGSGRSPGEGDGNPLQYSCLENPVDRAAWRAVVHGVTESQT